MNDLPLTDDWILAQRPPRNAVDPSRPYAFFVEPERTRAGSVVDVATVFLTNRECPFRCLMCDLWKNTTPERVPPGAIPTQLEYALEHLPPARHIKLYNAGNFFDAQAVPPGDLPRIAEILTPFQTVIIENHPRLIGPRCLAFRDLLAGELQVAMGLETVHPEVLARLNKRMTLGDFEGAVRFLVGHGIAVRAFILLRPPFLTEEAGLLWAQRSLEWASSVGVECCTIIPTRAGNGAMERLQEQGDFQPPTLGSLEKALEHGIGLASRGLTPPERGRVFADLWDIEKLFACPRCGPARARRIDVLNRTQALAPPVECECGGR